MELKERLYQTLTGSSGITQYVNIDNICYNLIDENQLNTNTIVYNLIVSSPLKDMRGVIFAKNYDVEININSPTLTQLYQINDEIVKTFEKELRIFQNDVQRPFFDNENNIFTLSLTFNFENVVEN